IFGLHILHAIGDDLLMQGTVVVVLLLHQSLRLIGNGNLNCVTLRCQSIANLLETSPILAAAICKLSSQSIGILHIGHSISLNCLLESKGVLHGIHGAILDSTLDTIKTGQHGIVHGIEAVGKAILKTIQLVGNALVVKAALNITNSSDSRFTPTAITAAHTSTAIAKATITETAKQSHQDDDNPPTFAEAITANAIHHAITSVVAATIIVTNDGSNIRCAESIRAAHMFTSSLVKIKRFLRICLIYALQSRLRALPITSKHSLRLGYRWVKNCIACLQASSGEIP